MHREQVRNVIKTQLRNGNNLIVSASVTFLNLIHAFSSTVLVEKLTLCYETKRNAKKLRFPGLALCGNPRQ